MRQYGVVSEMTIWIYVTGKLTILKRFKRGRFEFKAIARAFDARANAPKHQVLNKCNTLTCNIYTEWLANKVQGMLVITAADLKYHTTIRVRKSRVIQSDTSAKSEALIQSKQCSHIFVKLRNDLILFWVLNIALIVKMPPVHRTAVLFSAG